MTRIEIKPSVCNSADVKYNIDTRMWSVVGQWIFLERLDARQSGRAYYCGPPQSIWQLRESIKSAMTNGGTAHLFGTTSGGKKVECLLTFDDLASVESMVMVAASGGSAG